MVRPNALTPVLHSAIGISRFGKSRFLMHKVTGLAKPRIPTSQDLWPRALSDQWLKSIREIAGRDFKEYKTLASGNAERRTPIQRDPAPRVLVQINGADSFGESRFAILRGVNPRLINPRMPIPRSPMGFDPSSPVLTAISRATLPRSEGPRDFGFLLDNSKSSILFLLRILRSPPSSCATETKGLSLLSFCQLGLLQSFLEHVHWARSSPTSKSDEVLWVLCAHTRNSFNRSLLGSVRLRSQQFQPSPSQTCC
jgi:hypothetical protein